MLERLEAKIDRVIETQTQQAVTLARNTTSLEEHVSRTTDLKDSLKDHMTEDVRALHAIRAELAPLAKSNAMWIGAGKVLAVLLMASGVVVEIIHALARAR